MPFWVNLRDFTSDSIDYDFQMNQSISDYLSSMEKNEKKDQKNDYKLTTELIANLFHKCIHQSEEYDFHCIYKTEHDSNYWHQS